MQILTARTVDNDHPRTVIEHIDDVISGVEGLTRLHEVRNRCLRAGNDFDDCLRAILDTALFIAGAESGLLELAEPETGILKIRAQRGRDQPLLDFIPNGDRAVSAGAGAAEGTVHSTPLMGGNQQVFGTICIHFRLPTRLGERERHLLDLLAEQAAAYVESKQTESLLGRVTPRVGTLITQCSRSLRFLFVNRLCEEFFGKPADLIVGHSIVEILGDAAFQVIRPYVVRVLSGERVEYEAEIPYAAAGSRHVHVIYVPAFDLEGTVSGWVAAINDISNRTNLSGSRMPSGRWHVRRTWFQACQARPTARL